MLFVIYALVNTVTSLIFKDVKIQSLEPKLVLTKYETVNLKGNLLVLSFKYV